MSTSISDLGTHDRAQMVRDIDAVLTGYGIQERSRDAFWLPVVATGMLRGA